MSTELARVDPQEVTVNPVIPQQLYRMATDVAGVCREIVTKTVRTIQKRRYVQIEGWQAIATAHGCCLSVESVTESESGDVTCVGSVKRMADGVVIARAEGFVGMDEKRWRDGPRYARRAMAQTRAMSRAARSAFAHVVVLIDSGLSTTPAEEVPEDGFDHHRRHEVVSEVTGEVRNHEPAAPEPFTDDVLFSADLDEMFKQRGFSPEAADIVIKNVLAKKGAKTLKNLPPAVRRAFYESVKRGDMDKFKIQKAEELATAGK